MTKKYIATFADEAAEFEKMEDALSWALQKTLTVNVESFLISEVRTFVWTVQPPNQAPGGV